MIKAFLFDYDGVITRGVADAVIPGRLAHNLNIPVALASEWLMSIWTEFMKAELSESEVWAAFEVKYKLTITET